MKNAILVPGRPDEWEYYGSRERVLENVLENGSLEQPRHRGANKGAGV